MIRGVLLDLAGVIYEGEKALPGALKAVDQLRHAGLSLRFVTNTTRMTKSMVLQRLAGLGLTSPRASSSHPLRLCANGWQEPIALPRFSSIRIWFRNSNKFQFALTCGRGRRCRRGFRYASLNRAFRELIDGAQLIALAKNRSFKDADGLLSLDAGAFVAALEFGANMRHLSSASLRQSFLKPRLRAWTARQNTP